MKKESSLERFFEKERKRSKVNTQSWVHRNIILTRRKEEWGDFLLYLTPKEFKHLQKRLVKEGKIPKRMSKKELRTQYVQ